MDRKIRIALKLTMLVDESTSFLLELGALLISSAIREGKYLAFCVMKEERWMGFSASSVDDQTSTPPTYSWGSYKQRIDLT